MERVLVPTAAPHAILGVQSYAATASPNLCLDHQHLAWGGQKQLILGLGRAWRWGPSLGVPWYPLPLLTLVQLLPPFWGLPLICVVCPLTWLTPTPSSSFLADSVCLVLFFFSSVPFIFYGLIEV